MVNYYFDTSIWLDFFENRDELNFPKGEWAHKLISKITIEGNKIIVSDNVIIELSVLGYSEKEINNMFSVVKPLTIFVEATEKELGKAKDLGFKRNIPKRDALHALIARNTKSILVTLDKDFQKLTDIIKSKKPQDLF